MKVLLADSAISGHHLNYLEALCSLQGSEIEMVALLPEQVDLPCRVEVVSCPDDLKSYRSYLAWISAVADFAHDAKVDILHLLYGDILYRHFGIGIGRIPGKKICTFHHFRYSALHKCSLARIMSRIDVGVVHTNHLAEYARSISDCKIEMIDYPVFEQINRHSTKEFDRTLWGVDDSKPVLLCLGGTRFDKGLDVLLSALQRVSHPFWLLVAGSEEDVSLDMAVELSAQYHDSVSFHFRYLEPWEVVSAVNAADIVVLPYRRIFDGASGPLGIGVRMGKTIIGPNHGSIGRIIEENHLGVTFEAENPSSLMESLDSILSTRSFHPDSSFQDYGRRLNPDYFKENYLRIYKSLID